MAKVLLNFQGHQDSISIHHSKISKKSIESSILKKWFLQPSNYGVMFEDLDGDQIDALDERDYDFARQISSQKTICFTVYVKPAFKNMFKIVLSQQKNDKTDVEKAKISQKTDDQILESTQKASKPQTRSMKKNESKETQKKLDQLIESTIKAKKQMKRQNQSIGSSAISVTIQQKSKGMTKKLSLYEEKIETPQPEKKQKKAKQKVQKVKYPCEVCNVNLTIPYYFDPFQEIYFCKQCQQTYEQSYPVIKIKDKNYALDTAYTYMQFVKHDDLKLKGDDDNQVDKYLAQIKQFFIKDIREVFNQKIIYERELIKEEKKKEKEKKASKKGSKKSTKADGTKTSKIKMTLEYEQSA